MKISLGINTGFAINRFPEPEIWAQIVSEELGLSCVQFTADLLNPFLPADLMWREARRVAEACQRYGIHLETTFTSQFTRVNHLLHPDAAHREVWFQWFKRFFMISRFLGAVGSGSHFGILSVHDNSDPERRKERIGEGVRLWRKLAEYGAALGFRFLMFEPMSVPRELGETRAATRELLERCADFAIPMRLCLDVDHGDVCSNDPRDYDPYAWLAEFGTVSAVIHIKQSLSDKSGHFPFTEEYNARGVIVPERVLAQLEQAGVKHCRLVLEISHRERRPMEDRVLADLKESVAYWQNGISTYTRRKTAVPMHDASAETSKPLPAE